MKIRRCLPLAAQIAGGFFLSLSGWTQPIEAAKTGPALPQYSYLAKDLDGLRSGFRHPPAQAGPWVFWFCWDNAITKDELLRELDELVAAGFAGAEMRFVEAQWLQDRFETELPQTKHRRLEFLSPEFVECLRALAQAASQRGFHLALNLGMGWPPGGTWITPEHQSKSLLFAEERISGRKTVKLAVPERAAPAEKAFAWRLRNGSKQVDPESFVDLSRTLREGKELEWTAPQGEWVVGFFRTGLGGKLDKASGFAADPGSATAMRFHLDHVFSRLDPALSTFYGNTITEITTDSWEYDNRPFWTPGLFGEFERATGRDLRKSMYEWLGYGPNRTEVEEEIDKAENQLVCANFFEQITRYAHARGLRYRPQIRGRGLYRDFFDAYARCDIPEVEQEIFPAEAAWVAHGLGMPIISVEAFTFLTAFNDQLGAFGASFGPWETTPDLLRRHSNLHFARGGNRLQMATFSYSPPGLPMPGWRLYAEIHLNDYVPWWPYLPYLNRWLARNQLVLQSGMPIPDTIVYPVKPNPPEAGIGGLAEVQPVDACNGVDALPRGWLSRIKERLVSPLVPAPRLLLLDQPQTGEEIADLADLAERGVLISYLKSLPETWRAGLINSGAKSVESLERILRSRKILDFRGLSWKEAVKRLQTVHWQPQSARLSYQHRRLGEAEVYFVVNETETPFDGTVSFPHKHRLPEVWDAESGIVFPAPEYVEEGESTQVKLRMKPYESAIVSFGAGGPKLHVTAVSGGKVRVQPDGALVFETERSGMMSVHLSDGTERQEQVTVAPVRPVGGPWKISANPKQCFGLKAPVELVLTRLVNWRDLPELHECFGRVQYASRFDLPERPSSSSGIILSLGQVGEVASVRVNGELAGVAWTAPYRVDITQQLRAGRNRVEIEVANQYGEKPKLSPKIAADFGLASEKQVVRLPRPSGLLGPVELVPYARRTILEAAKL